MGLFLEIAGGKKILEQEKTSEPERGLQGPFTR
jgi:hypothetical protein